MWLFSLDNLWLLQMVLSIHTGYLLSNTILFYVLKLVGRAGFSYRVFIYGGLVDSPLLPDSVSPLLSLLKPFHCQRSRLHFHAIFALHTFALKAPLPLSWAPFWFPENPCSFVCFVLMLLTHEYGVLMKACLPHCTCLPYCAFLPTC